MSGWFVTRAFVFLLPICFAHWTEALGAPGDLDPTFGAGGKVFVNFGSVCEGQALVVQPDGKIIAAGELSLSPA